MIEDAKILDSQEYYDPRSKMYTWEICVVYDRAGLYAVMEEQSARIKSDRARFEKYMQKYFDEMDHMQGRMTESERVQAQQQQFRQNDLNEEHQRRMQLNQQQFDNKQQTVQQQQHIILNIKTSRTNTGCNKISRTNNTTNRHTPTPLKIGNKTNNYGKPCIALSFV